MRTDRDIIRASLNKWRNELPPGTLLRRIPHVWKGPGGPRTTKSSEIRMVIYVDMKEHPGKWTELIITALGPNGIQPIEMEHTDFPRSWSKVDVAG